MPADLSTPSAAVATPLVEIPEQPGAPARSAGPQVSTVALAALRAQGRARNLIDVRTPAEFAAIHAEGARLVPLERLDPAAVLSSRVAPNEPIYVLCKSGGRAAKAAQRLAAAGAAVVVVEGGTDAWERAGLPVIRGKAAMSLERQVRIAAGSLVLAGIVLAATVHPWCLAISAFVGVGLVFAGITDTCGLGMLLARMPWNQRACCQQTCRPC